MPNPEDNPGFLFDFERLLNLQMVWSRMIFGPGKRTLGVTKHIAKELEEIKADPTDVEEWIDVMILGFDGAWRCSDLAPREIMQKYIDKMYKNIERKWPNWNEMNEDHAIEHIREGE